MNPITFVAFLVGMNTAPPIALPTTAEQKQKIEKPQLKPCADTGAPKRGGWDHN